MQLQRTKTDSDLYHGGSVAEEVAGLVSLALGIRVRAGGATRRFDGSDPQGTPIEWTARPAPVLLVRDPADGGWVLPNAAEEGHALDDLEIFSTLTRLTPQNTVALVRTSRLYQDALWLVESEPALAWLMLVSAVETAAVQWRKDKGSPAERLKASKTELYDYLLSLGSDVPERVAAYVADSLGATKKFLDFLMSFKPPAPSLRPPDWVQHSWDETSLKRTIRKVYGYRSLALHEGKPFPAPMCEPPRRLDLDWTARTEKPWGKAVSMGGGTWIADDIPILFHTFEYLARHALLKWWREGTPEQEPSF
jgi:hypothetical protein